MILTRMVCDECRKDITPGSEVRYKAPDLTLAMSGMLDFCSDACRNAFLKRAKANG